MLPPHTVTGPVNTGSGLKYKHKLTAYFISQLPVIEDSPKLSVCGFNIEMNSVCYH